MSREEAVKLATHVGKDSTTQAILLMRSKIDLDTYLSRLQWYMRNSSLEIIHNIEGHNHTITIKQDDREEEIGHSIKRQSLSQFLMRF